MGLLLKSTATVALPRILGFRVSDGLPLHVAGRIETAARQWPDVIDHVPRPSFRIAALHHELMLGGFAAGDPTVAIASDAGICRRCCGLRLGGLRGLRRG